MTARFIRKDITDSNPAAGSKPNSNQIPDFTPSSGPARSRPLRIVEKSEPSIEDILKDLEKLIPRAIEEQKNYSKLKSDSERIRRAKEATRAQNGPFQRLGDFITSTLTDKAQEKPDTELMRNQIFFSTRSKIFELLGSLARKGGVAINSEARNTGRVIAATNEQESKKTQSQSGTQPDPFRAQPLIDNLISSRILQEEYRNDLYQIFEIKVNQ